MSLMQNKIPLARLYRKTSAKSGESYFVGRLGQARVLLFRDRHEQAESGDEVWNMLVEAVDAAAPPKSPDPATDKGRRTERSPRRRASQENAPATAMVDDRVDDLWQAG